MLGEVKDALRVSGADLDDEIDGMIDAAKLDLLITGVRVDDNDPLIKRAVIIYCKAHFGYEDVNISERFERSYVMLKQHLTLSREYGADYEET